MTLLDIAVLSTDDDWLHPWLFPLIPLLWLLAFFPDLPVRLLAGRLARPARRPYPGRQRRQILAERYARGEISEEEYRTRSSGLAT